MDNKKFDLDSIKKEEARQAFQPYYAPDISLLPPLPSSSNSKRKSNAQHYEDVSVDSGSNSDDSSSKFSMITNNKALSNQAHSTSNRRITDQSSESNAIVSASNSSLDNVPKHPIKNTKQFLEKLYNMLNDPECSHLVHWSDSGTSFIIENHAEFAAKILPKYFKHNNFPSFIRQLNMYQFSKIPNLKQSVLHMTSESERQEFHNPNFLRDRPDLRILINRKNDSSSKRARYETKDVGHLNDEIKTLKLHQEALSERLSDLEHRNTKLIKENVDHKNRYQAQQQTIDKILSFLASLFSSDKSDALMPKKRKYLLDKVPSQEASTSNQTQLSNVPNDPNQIDYNTLVKYLSDINASSGNFNDMVSFEYVFNDDLVPRNESYFLDSSSLYNQTNPMYQNSSGMNQAQFNSQQNGLGTNQLLDPSYSHLTNFNPNLFQQQNGLTGASQNDLLPAYINPTRLIEPSTKSSPPLVPQGLAPVSSSSTTPAPDIFNPPATSAGNANPITTDALGLPDFLNTFDTNNILDGINLNNASNQQTNDFDFLNKNS